MEKNMWINKIILNNFRNYQKEIIELNKNLNKDKKINFIILNYQKNNISKYFYKIILKNKFNKIKIINLIN